MHGLENPRHGCLRLVSDEREQRNVEIEHFQWAWRQAQLGAALKVAKDESVLTAKETRRLRPRRAKPCEVNSLGFCRPAGTGGDQYHVLAEETGAWKRLLDFLVVFPIHAIVDFPLQ
ncbi:MAG: hypothetical protein IT427_20985 [Pirellulales bacterium]|nr:hypothetical protein [Pirellulales bacterium]